MELLLKFYMNKISRIGVKYLYEHTARSAYEQLLSQNPGETYQIRLEISGDKIHLLLMATQTGKKIVYPNLNYRPDEFKTFQKIIQNNPEFQFVHVFSKKNKVFIAKPFHREELIMVTHVEILNLLNR